MPAALAFRLVALLVLINFGASHAADPVTVTPEQPPWSVNGEFLFAGKAAKADEARRSLSGIACSPDLASPRRCVAVFDEGVEARYVVLGPNGMSPEPGGIVLLPGGKELDAEGAARDGAFVFVTGSHSVSRNKCTNNPDGRHVFRFSVDPATGRAQLAANGTPADLVSDKGRLWSLITRHPVLQAFAGDQKCLGSVAPPKASHLRGLHGVNIEGLAAKDGGLYFGFRGPAIDGNAHILRVAANALFSGGDLSDTLFTIPVGQGRGIRDLLTAPEGLLVLIGPDDDSKAGIGWSVALWNGAASNSLTMLAHLTLPPVRLNGCNERIRPEALTMLENGPDFRRLLILSDGLCEGGPLVFRIPK